MLVSEKNIIGSKLYDRISTVLSIDFVSPSAIRESDVGLQSVNPPVIFINQLDLGPYEEELLTSLRLSYPKSKIIALNTHMAPILKERTISMGYDGYISLFELGDELTRLLESLGVEAAL